jgi:DNA replication licensing factor MCM2
VACKLYPGYDQIHEELFVKFDEFPLEEKIRELRTYHIGTMIRVRGVITKKYPTYQKLKKLFYICIKCSDKKGPIYQNDEEDMQLGHCAGCQSKGPYKISDEERVYGVNQKIII